MRTFTEEEVEILIQKCREMDKPKTNFDRIKSMSVEEMAEHLHDKGICPLTEPYVCPYLDSDTTCTDCIKEWLQQKAEE